MKRAVAERRVAEGRRAGVVMLLAIGFGMVAANSSWSGLFDTLHHYPLRLDVRPLTIERPLIDWINQGLLVVFYFHIGLHTKHELTSGVLATPGGAALPAFAAFGGMLVPASLYLIVNAGDTEALQGWAIPIATDIVLVLGLLSFFGAAVSPGLLAYITAIAIFDDLGAVMVIAVFYGEVQAGLQLVAIAAGLFALAALMRTIADGVNPRHPTPNKHLNLPEFRDNLLRLMSLRSQLRSSVFLNITVDQLKGGGSGGLCADAQALVMAVPARHARSGLPVAMDDHYAAALSLQRTGLWCPGAT